MTHEALSTPAILLALLLASVLTLGCTDEHVVAPERQAAAEHDAATAHHAANDRGLTTETADVFGQGMSGSVVAGAEATIRRTPNGISTKLSMPTPEPGTYAYPEGADEGHPEAFTLWVFVFNDPESEEWDGAFHGAGHAVGGRHLNLSGHIALNTEPFVGEMLENPEGAKVHLAVAPHGALDPDKLPEQIKTPSGTPDHWWFALFE